MMKVKYYIVLLAILLTNSIETRAQVSVTSVQGQNVAQILQEHFLAAGVDLVTDNPFYQAKFNGSTTVNCNQVGIFTNTDTTGLHMPLDAGITIVSANCYEAGSNSNPSGGGANPQGNNNCLDMSPALYNTYHSMGGTNPMNDVACLSFYVIPRGNTMSFSYSFASQEYTGYVCSTFNDVFGLFITGPMDPVTGELMPDAVINENIALIPPDYVTPVSVNTVNSGNPSGNQQPCILTNTALHRLQTNIGPHCRMNGYTTELSTVPFDVWACYMYKLELAVCNIQDHILHSAVYLKANSMKSQSVTIKNTPSVENGVSQVTEDGYTVYTKGCASDTLGISLAFAEEAQFPYAMAVVPSQGSDLTSGVDYQITDQYGNPTGTSFILAPGNTEAKVIVHFLHNENKPAGTQDTLLIIPEYVNECTPVDTMKIILVEPEEFVPSIEGGKTYCSNELPAREFINISADKVKKFLAIEWENSLGESGIDTLRHETALDDMGYLETQIEVMVYEPVIYTVTISDSCGRSFTKQIEYKIQGATTKANVSKDYICEGEEIVLSCPEAAEYDWTSFPVDNSLLPIHTLQEPVVTPSEPTLYTINITDTNGCKATDTVRVIVVPAVEPRMYLNPTHTTLTNTAVEFKDITVNAARREWDFGDGTTSTLEYGFHTYPTQDTGTYVVTLVVYNAADCEEIITDTIYIEEDFTIYFPNAIEPGSDDLRIAEFKPFGTMEWYRLDIFNRWGEKVFNGEDNQPWDGTLKSGEFAPQGVYTYDVYYTDKHQLLQRATGSIMVLPKMKR